MTIEDFSPSPDKEIRFLLLRKIDVTLELDAINEIARHSGGGVAEDTIYLNRKVLSAKLCRLQDRIDELLDTINSKPKVYPSLDTKTSVSFYDIPLMVVIGNDHEEVTQYCGNLLMEAPYPVLILPFVGVSHEVVRKVVGFNSHHMQLFVLNPSAWTVEEKKLIDAVEANLGCCPNYLRVDVDDKPKVPSDIWKFHSGDLVAASHELRGYSKHIEATYFVDEGTQFIVLGESRQPLAPLVVSLENDTTWIITVSPSDIVLVKPTE